MKFARVAPGLLLLSAVGAAQQYAISTIAGGAPPATPSPAVSGSIGAPISVTADAVGSAYFTSPDLNVVLKRDAARLLARVAENRRAGYSGDGGRLILLTRQLTGLESYEQLRRWLCSVTYY